MSACAAAESYTMMPPYSTDPKDYINKWDPFVLRSLPGPPEPFLSVLNRYNQTYKRELVDNPREPFPLANGRQIARDTRGNWFVLVEKDSRLFLGCTGDAGLPTPVLRRFFLRRRPPP